MRPVHSSLYIAETFRVAFGFYRTAIKRKDFTMIQPKKKDDENIAFKDDELGGNPLRDAFQKAEQAATKKFEEPRVLVECSFIIEVAQSVATKGKHANYVEQLTRSMLDQNKNIKNIIDVDAFEPEADGA